MSELAKYVGKRCIHVDKRPASFSGGKWHYTTERREVILMAIVKSYAMVRRPGCIPYVASLKELQPPAP